MPLPPETTIEQDTAGVDDDTLQLAINAAAASEQREAAKIAAITAADLAEKWPSSSLQAVLDARQAS